MKTLSLLLAGLVISNTAYAANVHTWHDIYVKEGTWVGKLSSINEESIFTNAEGANISSFKVIAGYPFKYGFGFEPGADFNIAYTLTLVEQNKSAFSSKACVFVITASGPARPDIKALSYNGASCESAVVKGVGENFFVG